MRTLLLAVVFAVAIASVCVTQPENPSKRTLTSAQRVSYQRAIEEVYWRHRIWPKQHPDPKPSLDAVMSQAQLETKVQDYLLKSQMLEDHWQRPITTEQLQAEMDRMAKHTKQPEVLRELFKALGNDPFAIAECLARPALAERNLAVVAPRTQPMEVSRARVEAPIHKAAYAASASYALPRISNKPNGCTDDTWTATSTTNAQLNGDIHSNCDADSDVKSESYTGSTSSTHSGTASVRMQRCDRLARLGASFILS